MLRRSLLLGLLALLFAATAAAAPVTYVLQTPGVV
jgi:hypothetical protein